ncbi:5fadbfc9-c512-4b0f-a5f0-7e3140a57e8a [Thermothielavioides terrestris]|uniref:5fadbfc9-c512-4b0f-a5f0-7e3140a57e8a n=1 Tax=Thermothielavioides terrestris TaxID=2587410 RepID=A0A446B8A6_9PEZI|nr:5fadbfc9-c512-4b0f-a5f0-7e3140a57e8a [Thermothielavioides terrestris]
MVSDETYEICLPILQDPNIEDEDKTDKLEELLKEKTSLTGQALENATNYFATAIAGFLAWFWDPALELASLGRQSACPPRLLADALWSHKVVDGFALRIPETIPEARFANDEAPSQEVFGDYQSDNVDWLVSDDAASVASSVGASNGLNVSAPEFVSMQHQADMTPYDMLRSILGQSKSDEEISAALALHGYDLGATVAAIMETQAQDNRASAAQAEEGRVVIGKAMATDGRPATPADQQKTGVICKFYLSTGQCLRADCRFSHDLSSHICKYWVAGNCLAGNTCVFSHDPAHLVNRLNVDGSGTPPTQHAAVNVQDYSSFPALQPSTPEQTPFFLAAANYPAVGVTPPPGFKAHHGGYPDRPRSRPGSRHQQKDNAQTAPSPDDADAFPSLGSAAVKQAKKHHGKRGGHGHGTHKENAAPSTLADIVKMSPSPTPALQQNRRMPRNGSSTSVRNGENSAAAQAIPSPKHIPWLETGERANKAYLKARQEAIKHGGLRNKFLQSAAQAWNRNDARAAKALSLRGQSENELMKKAHREAAQLLYEQRNKDRASCPEIYVDLHGLHPEEAVEYLEGILMENAAESRPIYAITGTGHHSKNGKDKVGKAVRSFLNEWRYAYREFSVPGDRNSTGGILGIDARSWDRSLSQDGKSLTRKEEGKEEVDILSQGVEIGDGKVKLLVRDTSVSKEPPKGPSGARAR